jgi:hypothetical protein
VTFSPTAVGDYTVTVLHSNQPIQGSPLRVPVVARLFNYANGAMSKILDSALEQVLAPMFPGGILPQELMLLIAADGGIPAANVKAATKNVAKRVLKGW